jgi:hypothetical protein
MQIYTNFSSVRLPGWRDHLIAGKIPNQWKFDFICLYLCIETFHLNSFQTFDSDTQRCSVSAITMSFFHASRGGSEKGYDFLNSLKLISLKT